MEHLRDPEAVAALQAALEQERERIEELEAHVQTAKEQSLQELQAAKEQAAAELGLIVKELRAAQADAAKERDAKQAMLKERETIQTQLLR